MNAHKFPLGRSNTAPVSAPIAPASGYSPVPEVGASPSRIGASASSGVATTPTGEAGAPNLSTPSDGYGKQPRCETCGGGFYGCLCTAPEPDVMHVSDMKRVMPEFFADSGWALAEASAERSAVLMPGSSGR